MDVDSICIENSPRKKGKNVLEKDNASDAGNSDTKETAPHSPTTLLTQTQNNPRRKLNLNQKK